MKYIVYNDDFDTEEEAQAFLDKLNEKASLEDSYFIHKTEQK